MASTTNVICQSYCSLNVRTTGSSTRSAKALAPAKSTSHLRAVSSKPATAQRSSKLLCEASIQSTESPLSRRGLLSFVALTGLATELVDAPQPAFADDMEICTADCLTALDNIEMVTTESGLQYKDVVVGKGPKPPTGYQVVVDFQGLVPSPKGDKLQVFNTASRTDVRVTGDPSTASVIAGLDEGISGMQVGGQRRLYIPGKLAFPNGLASAPGRPRVLPNSDVIFDVKLLYIPGLDFDEDEEY